MVVKAPTIRRRDRWIGPRDAGRILPEADYLQRDDRPGCVSELIDGVVLVSPRPKRFHQAWQFDLATHLRNFAAANPAVINFVATDVDVVIPGRLGPTRPRPDIAAYAGFPPREQWKPEDDWSEVSPMLVVEVISGRRVRKETLRNRTLYGSVPAILEYWVVDPRRDPHRPTLRVLIREAGAADWTEREFAYGDGWESRRLAPLRVNLAELPKQGT